MINYGFIAAFTGNIISFIAGTSITWMSPELSKFNETDTSPFDRVITVDETSWISSLMALGAAFGPFIFGYAADKFGRKLTLLSLAIPFIVCYLILAFCKIVELFYFARFFIGLGVGGVFTVIPMYIGEVAEDSNRGLLGSSMNCFICFGLVFSYALGPYVSVMVFNGILAIFPVIFMVLFFFIAPETPHYYVAKNENEKAKEILKKLRGTDSIDKEIGEIQTAIEKSGNGSFMDIFRSKGLTKAFVISISLVAFQQFSGINAVLSYAGVIFQDAGSSIEPEICAIIIGATQFGTSFITPMVSDRLGRKILLIFSGVGMVIAEIPLGIYFIMQKNGDDVSGISFLPIICLVLYIITYNCGFGPLAWSVMGELFPSNVKSIASSITAGICWLIGFFITKYFQSVSNAIGIGVAFLIFSGFCIAATIFSATYVIETKGKSFQEIEKALNS